MRIGIQLKRVVVDVTIMSGNRGSDRCLWMAQLATSVDREYAHRLEESYRITLTLFDLNGTIDDNFRPYSASSSVEVLEQTF